MSSNNTGISSKPLTGPRSSTVIPPWAPKPVSGSGVLSFGCEPSGHQGGAALLDNTVRFTEDSMQEQDNAPILFAPSLYDTANAIGKMMSGWKTAKNSSAGVGFDCAEAFRSALPTSVSPDTHYSKLGKKSVLDTSKKSVTDSVSITPRGWKAPVSLIFTAAPSDMSMLVDVLRMNPEFARDAVDLAQVPSVLQSDLATDVNPVSLGGQVMHKEDSAYAFAPQGYSYSNATSSAK